jgi:hypothetical protein
MAEPTIKANLPDEKFEVINDTYGTNIDPIAEKKLLRKCDLHVLPPLFVLFLLAFLDRTNIGILNRTDWVGTIILQSEQAMQRSRASPKNSTWKARTQDATTLLSSYSSFRTSCSKYRRT